MARVPSPKASAAGPAASRARFARGIETAVIARLWHAASGAESVLATVQEWGRPRCARRRRLLASPSTLDERSGTMRWMNGRARLATVALAVIAAVVAGGCSGGGGSGDKAGGSGEPVVLRMANAYGDLQTAPVVGHFVSQVKERSGGNLRVQVASTWGDFADDAEQQVVRAVAAGKVDLGWAGARVFDTLGVTSLQALQAPMLIDNYALEHAVITHGIPGQMLEGLNKVGVMGFGILADGLRKPIAVKHPVLGTADWRGITFGTYKSQDQAQAIRSLGATPVEVFGTERDQALKDGKIQGFELNLPGYERNVL